MARRKRQSPALTVAQTYLALHVPEMRGSRLTLRMLDGPRGSPRYSVTAELCTTGACPHDIAPAIAAAGQCPLISCPLRASVRMLLDRGGTVVQVVRGDTHWS